MAAVHASAKRKIDEDLDSEDELFLAHENAKKKTQSETAEEMVSTSKANDAIPTKPTNNTSSPSVVNSNKSLVQPKLAFFQKQPQAKKEETPKKSDAQIQNTLVAKEASSPAPVQIKPIVRPNGEWQIQDYLTDPTWRSLLQFELEKKYFESINNHIRDGYKKNIVRPPKELVFNALNSTKLSMIKVVIIGQDPYHDDGQAHGLAFSVPKGKAVPPSLRNIYIELKNDIPDFENDENNGGCLQKWTTEGVFLLNTFLTVEAHKPGSHSKIGWDRFTDAVIKLISSNNSGCVFLLWGNFAQQKESLIDKKKHKIVKCAHPSPLSVKRFFGSKCFSQANAYLVSIDKKPINWSLKNN